MPSPKEMRRRMEVQGYLGQTDQNIDGIGSWIQFTPAVNTAILTIGVLLGSPRILLLLAFLTGLGAVFPLHPFDLLYNKVVRVFTHTRELPPSGARRRFVFGIECWWLLITTWLFTSGHFGWGFTSGCFLIALFLLLALANICAISELLQKIFGTPGLKR